MSSFYSIVFWFLLMKYLTYGYAEGPGSPGVVRGQKKINEKKNYRIYLANNTPGHP